MTQVGKYLYNSLLVLWPRYVKVITQTLKNLSKTEFEVTLSMLDLNQFS